MLLAVDDEGVVLDDEVLFEFDDDDEPPFDEVARNRLNKQRIALDSPSPIVDRYSNINGMPNTAYRSAAVCGRKKQIF